MSGQRPVWGRSPLPKPEPDLLGGVFKAVLVVVRQRDVNRDVHLDQRVWGRHDNNGCSEGTTRSSGMDTVTRAD
ncbi:hypothetical protein TSOC_007573 [Tetrabaena socialis]|uniref:Uncharacterized protein n=1 Tax=Tetrabaena socialis TaxID=47790 RepID=A0A2J8A0Q4_9CHLO|nr:hypothetical protein TSOC_007573 [Tetrabaena socialis]|eukprot:PNH06096.1 hypothetical protein TSOC_007573 [Tetrabaena socialis]